MSVQYNSSIRTCGRTQEVAGVDLGEEVGVEAAGLDGQEVQLALLVALGQNVLGYRALADQPVDVHLPGLPYAVAPGLGLGSPPRPSKHVSCMYGQVALLSCS